MHQNCLFGIVMGGNGKDERECVSATNLKMFKKYLDVKSPWLPNSWFNFLFIFTKIKGFFFFLLRQKAECLLTYSVRFLHYWPMFPG